MSPSEVPPDGIVRTALQLLPVPPHGDDFWSRLEASLDAEEPLSAPVEPDRRVLVADDGLPQERGAAPLLELEPDRSLAVVPPAFRRTSNAVLAVVAAAALVVVGVAWTSLQEQDGTQIASDDPDTAELQSLVQQAQGSDATVTTMSTDREDASSEAVLDWVGHLGAGDGEAAWSAMGESSQAHFDSQAEFEEMMTDLAEGYGAWSAAEPDDVLVTPVAADDEGTIAVVTLVGTVEQEGAAQPRAEAFPVRIVDGEVVVEPFASAGPLEVAVPEAAGHGGYESVGTSEELVFVLPGDAEAPVLRIDGGDTVVCGEAEGSELSDLDQSPGQRCAYLPEGGFDPGEHTVTIAFLGADGTSVTAESLLVQAA